MYSYNTEIKYSDCAPSGKLKIHSLMNYLQDCCMSHSNSIGFNLDHYRSKKMGWLLASWQVVIEDLPSFGDKVMVETRPYEFRSLYGMRNFRMENEKGESIIKANSIWFLFDFEKNSPIRCPKEEAEGYGTDEKLDMEYAPRKLELPDDFENMEDTDEILECYLDTNRHVNNSQYINLAYQIVQKYAEGRIPGESIESAGFYPTVKEIRAEYKKAAKYKDTVHYRLSFGEDTAFVDMTDDEGASFASVSFRFK